MNRVSCRGERLFVPIGLGESTAYVIAILAAFALRAFRLGYQELRGDEAFGYFFSLQSGADILRNTLALREPHPVAGYFVAKAWMALVGDSEFALRFVSLWWGVLAVALLYRLACCLGLSRVAAFVAAALAVLSPYAIWHSQDGRMYAMSLALSLGSTWLALKALRRERWRYWAGYVLVSWLALHTHYYTIFVLVAQNAFVLGQAALVPAERVVLKRWLAAQLALGLLYLPWLIAAHATLTGYVGNGDSPGLASMLQRALATLVVGESLPSPVGDLRLHTRGWVSLLIDALVVLGAGRLIVSGSRGRRAAGLLGLYLVVPLAALWLSAQSRPIFNERYLIVAAPPCYLLLAAAARPNPPGPPSLAGKGGEVLPSPTRGGAGGEALPSAIRNLQSAIGLAGLALLLVAIGASLWHYYADPVYSRAIGWRELAVALDRLAGGLPAGQIRLVQNYPDPTLWYYYRGSVPHLVLPPASHDAAGSAQEVTRLAADGVGRVVFVAQPSPAWDDTGVAEEALGREYRKVAEQQVVGWLVQVYVRPAEALPETGQAFADGLILDAAAIEPLTVPVGGMVAVHLRWRSPLPRLPRAIKITLQLLDADGKLVAQTDQDFMAGQDGQPVGSYGVLVPSDARPGNYRLIVALYDPSRPNAPRLLTADGRDHVELAQVQVTAGAPAGSQGGDFPRRRQDTKDSKQSLSIHGFVLKCPSSWL